MATDTSIEILDLRHFAAAALQPVLEAEGIVWKQRLNWDFRASIRLLAQYLDNHMLPGYVALAGERIVGYSFCVYEETKAVIGDVYASPGALAGGLDAAWAIEKTLLTHLLETLQNSPQVDRIESQLLLHPAGSLTGLFHEAEFQIFRRLYMVQSLVGRSRQVDAQVPLKLELRPWREEDLNGAARLIAEAYRGHPDSLINDQYRAVHGALRFLNNIVRYAGCGAFAPQASYVVRQRNGGEMVALIMGSRVSQECGHITQVCVHPEYRRQGLARTLLQVVAASFIRLGAVQVSLTVTESNGQAIDLYLSEGYSCTHTFDAAVWQRPETA